MLSSPRLRAALASLAVLTTSAAGLAASPASAMEEGTRPSGPARHVVVVRPTATVSHLTGADRITVRTGVRNPTAVRQPGTRVIAWLRNDSGRRYRAVSTPLPALAPGASTTVTATSLLVGVPAGTYRVRVCAIRLFESSCKTTYPRVTVTDPAPAGPAELRASVDDVDFGGTPVTTTSAPRRVTVTNVGGQPSGPVTASLELIGGDDGRPTGRRAVNSYDISATTCTSTLAAGAACTVDLTFSPSETGTYTARLRVSATPGGEVTTDLSGNGTELPFVQLVATPNPVEFPNTNVGSTSPDQVVTITNVGTATTSNFLTPQIATGGNFGGEPFCDTGGDGLAPSESCTITIRFIPSSSGAKTGTITYGGFGAGSVVIQFSGFGNPPA